MTTDREQWLEDQQLFLDFIRQSATRQFRSVLRLSNGVEVIRKTMADMMAGDRNKVLCGQAGIAMTFRLSVMILWEDALREGLTMVETLKMFRAALVDAIQEHRVNKAATDAMAEAEINQLLKESINRGSYGAE